MQVKRNITHLAKIGQTAVGGYSNVVIQSMTDTQTSDVDETVAQVIALANAGSEIVRLTVDTIDAAKAIPHIRDKLRAKGCGVPIVGCFHYNGHILLTEVPECAETLDKYRINPGNIGVGLKRDTNFEKVINTAIKYQKPIRIGVNWGSLDQNLLAKHMDEGVAKGLTDEQILINTIVTSALDSAAKAIEIGLPENMIILSAKVSQIPQLKLIYQQLAAKSAFPLHLGLTEAGMGIKGIVATSAALSSILQLGIGDTIRASITPAPGEPRINEVLVCKEVLQSLGLRNFTPSITSCPGCGRTTSDEFKKLTLEINSFISETINSNKDKYPGIENLKIAVMGCIVNGPGESKHADIGISLPGKGEKPSAVVFVDGEKKYTLRENITESFKDILLDYIEKKFEGSLSV